MMVDRSTQRDVSDRRGIIGGSSLGSLDESKPWSCRRRLAYQFLGYKASNKKEYNEAMRLGHFFEPQLRDWFSEEYQVDCKDGKFVMHPEYPFIGGHPDGLFDDDGIIEIKTASERSFNKLQYDGIYEAYQDQLTLYMAITERYEGYFVVGCSEDISRRFILNFPFDERRYERIIDKVIDFVAKCETKLPDRKGARSHGMVAACRRCEFRADCKPGCLKPGELR